VTRVRTKYINMRVEAGMEPVGVRSRYFPLTPLLWYEQNSLTIEYVNGEKT
jgi:hypothetical protein